MEKGASPKYKAPIEAIPSPPMSATSASLGPGMGSQSCGTEPGSPASIGGGASTVAKSLDEGRPPVGPPSEHSRMGGSSGELHPLQNPVILDVLFKRCSPDLLADCRLVCKQWLDLSLSSWRSAVVISLESYLDDEDGMRKIRIESTSGTSLQEFLEYAANPANKCHFELSFRIMDLHKWKIDLKNDLMGQFWNQFGSHLTFLTLYQCEFRRSDELQTIIYRSCPNLQNLDFNGCIFIPSERGRGRAVNQAEEYKDPKYGVRPGLKRLQIEFRPNHGFPLSWLEFFAHHLELTYLYLGFLRCFEHQEFSKGEMGRILGAIRTVRQHNKGKPLLPGGINNFGHQFIFSKGMDTVSRGNLALLQELQLPMNELCIGVYPGMEDDPHLKTTLELHARKLTKIVFEHDLDNPLPEGTNWVLPFHVEMEILRDLRILPEYPGNLTCLKYAPDLKTLAIVLGAHPGEMKMAGVRLLKLKTLHLLGNLLGKDDLLRLIKSLPNVEHLKVELDDELFPLVCANWRKLKSLIVDGNRLTDVGVTGMRSSQAKPKLRKSPNITYLKNLGDFQFESVHLTDESVYHGFLELPRLKSLTSLSKPLFGKKALAAMRRRGIDVNELDDDDEDISEEEEDWMNVGSDDDEEEED